MGFAARMATCNCREARSGHIHVLGRINPPGSVTVCACVTGYRTLVAGDHHFTLRGSSLEMNPISVQASSLSKLRSPVLKQSSPMLEGDSLSSRMHHSPGRFQAAAHSVKSYGCLDPVEFKLPTIIVVGIRGAGKSSLLERVAKCPIFPRGASACTAMPVKLQLAPVDHESDCSATVTWGGVTLSLQSKDDIPSEVAKIMESVDSVVTEEVTVCIRQVC